ncbi:MAG: HlyD family secretion protein [Alphaproteobacteria bacterium]|nr:HlyD family secretion protein [Alphaproteobacteria bacterium]
MIRGRQSLLRPLLLIGVPLVFIAGAVFFWLGGGRYIATENAYVKADIVQVAPEVAGRVLDVKIRDHEHVAAGDVLMTIDPEPFRLALAQADAELDAARSQVETLRATWREVQSELAEAESRAAHLGRQAARQIELAARGVVSATKQEEAEIEAISARDRAEVVRKRMQRVLTALNGNPELEADQHPLVREKRAARDRVALDLARTTLRAPVDGIAVNVKVQAGEQVRAATPLFVVVADHRPWIEANFKETQLTHVHVGQRATVVLDIYPDVTWEAVVESLSPATGAEFAVLPPQNASGNWVKVVQRLPVKLRLLPQGGEPTLRAGMTATVQIDTGRQRSVGDIVKLFVGTSSASAPTPAR